MPISALNRVRLTCLTVFLASGLALTAVIWLTAKTESEARLESFTVRQISQLSETAGIIPVELKSIIGDLDYLVDSELLQHFLAGDVGIEHLQNSYREFAAAKGVYDQVRFIGIDGLEAVRINYNGGNPSVVDNGQLADKSQRPYVQRTLTLDKGQCFVSPLDLNIEKNRVELPYKPTMRFSAPVYDPAGRLRGIVVLNYLASNLLELIPEKNNLLLSSDGHYLRGGPAGAQWGWVLGHGRCFAAENPGLWKKIAPADSGRLIDNDRLVLFTAIYPLSRACELRNSTHAAVMRPAAYLEQYKWKLVRIIDNLPRAAGVEALERRWLIIYTVALLLLGLFSVIGARYGIGRIEDRGNLMLARFALDNTPDNISLVDSRGRHHYVNESFARDLGYAREELKRLPIFEINPEMSAGRFAEIWRQVRQRGDYEYETRYRRSDGSEFHSQVSATRLQHEHGEYLFLSGRDITERKRAEHALKISRERLSLALAGAGLGLWDWDITTGDILHDDRWLAILGYRRGEIEPAITSWNELVHPEDSQRFMQALDAHLEGLSPVFKCEVRLREKSGRWRWIQSMGKVVDRDARGNPLRAVGTHLDIEDRKRAEERLTKAINDADSANRAKSDFLARMSHEIRTPINAIIGLSHLTLKTELDKRQRNYLDNITNASHSLLGVINDILDFSKIEAGKLELESIPFDLENVLRNLADIVTLRAEEKNLEIIYRFAPDVPFKLVGDPVKLNQILINLANNAIKFTGRGEIVLSVELAGQHGDRVELRFSVSDTGIGIETDLLPSLFESFTQADGTTTRRFGGTGLGLAICKRLAVMLGGRITAESVVGRGSTFTFTSMFHKQHSGQDPVRTVAAELRRMKVLVVGNNRTSRDALRKMLESLSFRVRAVSSGAEALAELAAEPEKHPFRLVLMDWRMPEMDGIETARRINENRNIPKVPTVIMVTGYGREEARRQAEKVGTEAFLVKPLTPSALLETIMDVFGVEHHKAGTGGTTGADRATGLKQLAGKRVLLVEDNEINQQVARELLVSAGMKVVIAADGAVAVAKAEKDDFDIVLMDIQMPVMDGYEATRIIRSQPRLRELPIVAMTAHAVSGERERSLEAGMNEHLTKPIDPDSLYDTILALLVTGVKRSPAGPDAEPAPRNHLDDLPGIDLDSALRRVAGNGKLLRNLILDFTARHQNSPAEIRRMLEQGDRDRARKLAHTLKGVAGNLSALSVRETAAELEAALGSAQDRDMDPLLDKLAAGMESIVRAAAELEAAPGHEREESSGAPSRGQVELSKMLAHLDNLLADNDMAASDLLGRISAMLEEDEEGTLLARRAQQQIRDLDYAAARKSLAELARQLKAEPEETGDG